MLALLLGLLVAVAGTAEAKIHHAVVDKDDRTLIPLTEAFGFAPNGMLVLTLRDIGIYRLHGSQDEVTNWERFGFFLSPVEADAALEQDLSDSTRCILDDVTNLITFKDTSIQHILEGKQDNLTVSWEMKEGSLVYLYFANCEPDTPVSFDAVIQMYNIDRNGAKDYLSVGDTSLDAVYWVSAQAQPLQAVLTGLARATFLQTVPWCDAATLGGLVPALLDSWRHGNAAAPRSRSTGQPHNSSVPTVVQQHISPPPRVRRQCLRCSRCAQRRGPTSSGPTSSTRTRFTTSCLGWAASRRSRSCRR
jgi:hypothetical protein